MKGWDGKISRLAYMFDMETLYKRAISELSDVDRLLLALSWEPVFVSADLFEPFKEGLIKVIRNCPENHVNHWPVISKWLEEERDQKVIGYGHYTTSVNDNNWVTRPEPSDDPDADPWEGFEQRYRTPDEVLHVTLGGEGFGHTQPPAAGGAVWLPPDLR